MVNQQYYPLFSEDMKPVMTVTDLFSEQELNDLSIQLSTVTAHAATIGGTIEEDATNKIRKSNILFLRDKTYFWVYDKLVTAVKHVNSINYNKTLYGIEPLQYTEYDSKYNGFYATHVDDNVKNLTNGLMRKLSFTMQLSEESEYAGGEVLIHSGEIVISKKYGDITFFDSQIPHEVTPVTSGFRKSLVGWVLGPRV